jgi:hypothetical protein
MREHATSQVQPYRFAKAENFTFNFGNEVAGYLPSGFPQTDKATPAIERAATINA